MSNFLISGSNGFIGGNFYNAFKKNNSIYRISFNKNDKNYINLNTLKSKKFLKNFIKKKKINYFINFGWSNINDPRSTKHLTENLKNFKILAQICEESKIKKFVSLGSIDEYKKNKIINEKGSTLELKKNKNLYAKSKTLSFFFLKKNYTQKYLHLRIPNVYGFKKKKKFLINKIYLNSNNNHKIIKLKNINQQRIYIFVNDLIKYIKKVTTSKKINGLLNIGYGTSISIYEYLKLYEKALKRFNIKISIQNFKYKKLNRFKFHSNFVIFPNYKKKLLNNLIKIVKLQIKYYKKEFK